MSAESGSGSGSVNESWMSGLSEEESSNQRRIEQQSARFHRLLQQLQQHLNQLAQANKQEQVETLDRDELVKRCYLLFLELKGSARAMGQLGEITKQQLQERKQRLDAVNLQYESILYERAHFLKQIAGAKSFVSKYPSLDLVAESSFRSSPASSLPSDPSSLTPHSLHVARLEDELARRTQLRERVAAEKERNAQIRAELDQERAFKHTFMTTMQELHEKTMPLVGELWPKHTEHAMPTAAESARISLLPAPLYTLWHAADCADKGGLDIVRNMQMRVSIIGEDSSAEKFNRHMLTDEWKTKASSILSKLALAASQDREEKQEAGDVEMQDVSRADRNSSTITGSDRVELLRCHPLSLQLTLQLPSASSAGMIPLELSFYFYPALRIISVGGRIPTSPSSSSSSSATLKRLASLPSIQLLDEVWIGDNGLTMPQLGELTTLYGQRVSTQLNQLIALDADGSQSALETGEKLNGLPYRWAQELCGLQYATPSVKPGDNTMRSGDVSFIALLDRLQRRIVSLVSQQ